MGPYYCCEYGLGTEMLLCLNLTRLVASTGQPPSIIIAACLLPELPELPKMFCSIRGLFAKSRLQTCSSIKKKNLFLLFLFVSFCVDTFQIPSVSQSCH